MQKIIIACLMLFTFGISHAQIIKGQVFDQDNRKEGLIGANVIWLGTSIGVATDVNGKFELNKKDSKVPALLISYIGYKTDTVNVANTDNISIFLELNALEAVEITGSISSRSISNTFNVEQISLNQLKTAACCNLSESFEQSPAVDVVYSDAVSGAKEIRMLGLDGYYSQILIENQPAVIGLNNIYGLQYIPGQWMRGIAVSKGIGSVVNGYNALTGQINVAYKSPEESDLFSINLFGTRHGYMELNTDFSYRLNDHVSTMLFAHGEAIQFKHDENKDGFHDHPLGWQANVLNKWDFHKDGKYEAQMGVGFIEDHKIAGSIAYNGKNTDETSIYGVNIHNRRYDLFAKTGFIFRKNNSSLGVQYRFFRHELEAQLGNKNYDGKQHFANVNVIYQTDLENPNHLLKLGTSFTSDNYKEHYLNKEFKRNEQIPGIFAEYTYKLKEKLVAIAGLRLDYNSVYGALVSPRLHLKYNPREDWVFRISAGKAYRSPNIFAENMGIYASSRALLITQNPALEAAWNYGINTTKSFQVNQKQWSLSLDYYRTDFQKQMVIDRENANFIEIYELNGKSFANSYQAELNMEFIKNLKMKLAYKRDDVYTTYKNELKRKALVPINRGLANLGYETNNEKWVFNITAQWVGKSRIPDTSLKPETFQLAEYSKDFALLNAQVNFRPNTFWDIYIGGENLTNYRQPHALIDSENPFGNNFDAGLIYGPVDGVRLYAGFRYVIPYAKSDRKK